MSMPMDPFGGTGVRDPNRILQELSQRVAALEAQVREARGVPITRASSGFQIPESAGSTPASGVYLYASGSEFRWRGSDGSDYSAIPPDVPSGVAVSDPILVVGNAPGSYDSTFADTQSAAINEKHNKLIALLDSLRGAGLISSF
ncbi:hypothetical protein ACWENQ_08290 [Nonomuraea sp. NPDC004354]